MTKVILMGATGFFECEILHRLLKRPDVTEISCLSRRRPGPTSAKLSVLLHDDFARYDDQVLDRLAGHDACIWAMGGKAVDLGRPGELERVTHTFTLAFARALAGSRSDRFTFCYLSGMGADPSETAWLPWERQTRHLKGRTERDLAELQPAGLPPQYLAGVEHRIRQHHSHAGPVFSKRNERQHPLTVSPAGTPLVSIEEITPRA